MKKTKMGERFIKLKEVMNRTGLSRSMIYLRMTEVTFPKQVRVGIRAVRWRESEIDAWMGDCIEHRDNRKEAA